jgi:hypothetical protein
VSADSYVGALWGCWHKCQRSLARDWAWPTSKLGSVSWAVKYFAKNWRLRLHVLLSMTKKIYPNVGFKFFPMKIVNATLATKVHGQEHRFGWVFCFRMGLHLLSKIISLRVNILILLTLHTCILPAIHNYLFVCNIVSHHVSLFFYDIFSPKKILRLSLLCHSSPYAISASKKV